MTKSEQYVHRLLLEKPTCTRTGIPVAIEKDGWSVRTFSGRSNNGTYSCYGPCDYPHLFGWDKEPSLESKLDLVMQHLGLEFEYIPSHIKVVKRNKG